MLSRLTRYGARRQWPLAVVALWGLAPGVAAAQAGHSLAPYVDSIPGTLVTFEMVPVPAGTVTVRAGDRVRRVPVAAFWIARTEVTWDAYDVFALGLDTIGDASRPADAVARPTRPYGAPDYGFGHAGHPAISIARQGAEAFCVWLSARTGQRYRLPTEAEWLRAAELAAGATRTSERLDGVAWHGGNAAGRTHPVGTKAPDALGLYDLFGNAAEWVSAEGGANVLRGGAFRDPLDAVGPEARAVQDDTWNERDPQVPKSPWWLSDAPFAGFRIVREP